jgi:hypothetical protein
MTPEHLAHHCAECGEAIDGDPWWFHPLIPNPPVMQAHGAGEYTPLVRLPSPEPRVEWPEGGHAFHHDCLQRRPARDAKAQEP